MFKLKNTWTVTPFLMKQLLFYITDNSALTLKVGKKSLCSKISTELERRENNMNVHTASEGGIFALRTSKPLLSFASMATLSYPKFTELTFTTNLCS